MDPSENSHHEQHAHRFGETRQPASGLESFEAALADLQPRRDRLDTDRLLFLAGQQSAVRSRWGWSLFSSAMTGLVSVAATVLIMMAVSNSAVAPGNRAAGEDRVVESSAGQAERPLRDELDMRLVETDRPANDPTLTVMPSVRNASLRVRANRIGAIDRMLREGGSPWQGSRAASKSDDEPSQPYYRQMRELLGRQAAVLP